MSKRDILMSAAWSLFLWSQATFAAYPPGSAQRQLKPMMTEEQVVGLIGEPDGVEYSPKNDLHIPERTFRYSTGTDTLLVRFHWSHAGGGHWFLDSWSN